MTGKSQRFSRSGSVTAAQTSTAHSRRAPSGRTRAKPLSRRTRRCCETAGWVIPNSAWTAAVISPECCRPSASSSRIRRRTGCPGDTPERNPHVSDPHERVAEEERNVTAPAGG
jgi:hypothetical protein